MDETAPQDGQLPLHGVGDRLRMAREAGGMTLAQLAAETRIPERHLGLIEKGDFAALPARTYATGFARTYARAVGLDEKTVLEDVRAELAQSQYGERGRAATFEPGDPARIPSRGLALFSLAALVILIAGGVVFYQQVLAPGSGPASLLEEQRVADEAAARQRAATPVAPSVQASGPVVFTALEDGIWVKFTDADGKQLFQKELARGEGYVVPADAMGPTLWTGRPDALAITIGGKAVSKIAESEGIVKDVPVTAAALLARGTEVTPVAASTPAAVATPSQRPMPRAQRQPSRPRPAPQPVETVSEPVVQPVPDAAAEPEA